MKKLIITNTAVGENELQLLARERAVSVMNYLITKGGLPPERLFQKNDEMMISTRHRKKIPSVGTGWSCPFVVRSFFMLQISEPSVYYHNKSRSLSPKR